ncbi:nucleotidyltransferase domain-containing protein, partial [uncultured Marinobacter sp.]|uniref:nucleotidyltransferase domain-containing protein n=1 Tax=uncultured Marinobacter sp. TaxID=187379 RepID=UPI0030D874DF
MDTHELANRISAEPSPVQAARELLKTAYQDDAQAFRDGGDVRVLVRSRADTVDLVLRQIWNRYPFSQSPDIALIAVGGYGRGELHPHSDIDLLVLTRDGIEEDWQEDLSAFVTLLWDLKLDIGHSVRSLEESRQSAREDVTILTNLLETRTIAGAGDLCTQLSRAVYSDDVSTD